MFEILSERIMVACKRPDLQESAGLSEAECADSVRGRKAACKSRSRIEIPDELIDSKERYERYEAEFKRYLDCLIPPTDQGAEAQAPGDQEIA